LAAVTFTDVRIVGHCVIQIRATLFNRKFLQAVAETTCAAVPAAVPLDLPGLPTINAATATAATIPHWLEALVGMMFFCDGDFDDCGYCKNLKMAMP
jgi:hypothetical protein